MHYITELSGLLKISLNYHLSKILAISSKLGFSGNVGCIQTVSFCSNAPADPRYIIMVENLL